MRRIGSSDESNAKQMVPKDTNRVWVGRSSFFVHRTQPMIDRHGKVIWIDTAIAPILHLLWVAGIGTLNSCESWETSGEAVVTVPGFDLEWALLLLGKKNISRVEPSPLRDHPDAVQIFFPPARIDAIIKRLTPTRTRNGMKWKCGFQIGF